MDRSGRPASQAVTVESAARSRDSGPIGTTRARSAQPLALMIAPAIGPSCATAGAMAMIASSPWW